MENYGTLKKWKNWSVHKKNGTHIEKCGLKKSLQFYNSIMFNKQKKKCKQLEYHKTVLGQHLKFLPKFTFALSTFAKITDFVFTI